MNTQNQSTAAAAQNDGAAPAGADDQGVQQQEQVVDERPAKTSREAIYARHAEKRQEEIAEDPERHAALSALAGRPVEQQQSAQAADQQQAGADASGTEGVALDTKTIKLNVEGQDVEVSEDEVRQAGIRTLQKDRSADHKLQRASSVEALANQRLAEADAKLKQTGGLPSSGDRNDNADGRPSSQDDGQSAEAISKEAAEQARTVLFDEGDPEKAAKVLLEVPRKAVVEETNRMFVSEFGDIASNPAAFQKAVAMMNNEMKKTSNFAAFPAIATRIGHAIRAELTSQVQIPADTRQAEQGGDRATDQQQQQQTSSGVKSRADVKARLPIMPSRATTKTPDAKPAQASTRLTPSQIVQNMRVARGQARPAS